MKTTVFICKSKNPKKSLGDAGDSTRISVAVARLPCRRSTDLGLSLAPIITTHIQTSVFDLVSLCLLKYVNYTLPLSQRLYAIDL